MLEKLFHLSERKSDVRTELIAGATTFMTMAYIIFVNPGILAKAGVPFEAAGGIGYGFIVYNLSTLFTGNFRKTSWIVHVVSLFFLATFIVEDFINSGCAVSNAACWLGR